MPEFVVDLERIKYLHCGLGQFSLHFAEALLAECSSDWDPVFLLPRRCSGIFTPHAPKSLTAAIWRRESMQRFTRPLALGYRRSPSYDVWHATHQDTRFWPWNLSVPVVLTIHDLNFLRTKSPRVIQRRLRVLQKKIDRATLLASGSAHAAAEIRQHLQLGGKPVHVIPNGVCLDRDTIPERPASFPSDVRFLFTIGDIRRSKNFHVLVDMLAQLPGLTLVIAGSKKDPYAGAIEERAAQLGLRDRVWMPGRVSESERMWLYQHCEALVFPSLAEGFGLPLIEAMHCGRPVFSSRCTSLPEVGGELAFYWDDFAPESMADRVREGLQAFHRDPTFRGRLQAWSHQFTWPRVARSYLDLYRSAISGSIGACRSAA